MKEFIPYIIVAALCFSVGGFVGNLTAVRPDCPELKPDQSIVTVGETDCSRVVFGECKIEGTVNPNCFVTVWPYPEDDSKRGRNSYARAWDDDLTPNCRLRLLTEVERMLWK
jgi:hypothetical protein